MDLNTQGTWGKAIERMHVSYSTFKNHIEFMILVKTINVSLLKKQQQLSKENQCLREVVHVDPGVLHTR